MKEKRKIRSLIQRIKSKGGRSRGVITAPRKSNSFIKKMYRFIDFSRNNLKNQMATIMRIEYDPNRNCRIALLVYPQGCLNYIISAETNKIGNKISNDLSSSLNINPGNSIKINKLATGSLIYNLSSSPKLIGQYVRAAGSSAVLVKNNKSVSLIKLKSGEYRYFFSNTLAVFGQVNNGEYFLKSWETAGKARRLGIRPRTRALAKNPVDHPMGGRTKGGTPKLTPNGKVCLNTETKKKINKLVIIKAREKKKI